MIEKMNKDSNKVLIGMADSENLPFSDDQFESYVANFSLNLVSDHEKMLSEAKRVIYSYYLLI